MICETNDGEMRCDDKIDYFDKKTSWKATDKKTHSLRSCRNVSSSSLLFNDVRDPPPLIKHRLCFNEFPGERRGC